MKRHQIQEKLNNYTDVHAMLSAMKSVALVELKKLSGQLERQRQTLGTVEIAAADLLAFYPLPIETGHHVRIVVGSERGFCGDFNESLLPCIITNDQSQHTLIVIGSGLTEHLSEQTTAYRLPGPSILEEIPAIIEGLSNLLAEIQRAKTEKPLRISVLHHVQHGIIEKLISPIPSATEQATSTQPYHSAPALTLAPEELLAGFMKQSILLSLQEIFTQSLSAENYQRVTHMENALKHLDELNEKLLREMNRARQENIIQEIETILLNSSVLPSE
jgi:F-type H+-transporting ATPase subunit gamma